MREQGMATKSVKVWTRLRDFWLYNLLAGASYCCTFIAAHIIILSHTRPLFHPTVANELQLISSSFSINNMIFFFVNQKVNNRLQKLENSGSL